MRLDGGRVHGDLIIGNALLLARAFVSGNEFYI